MAFLFKSIGTGATNALSEQVSSLLSGMQLNLNVMSDDQYALLKNIQQQYNSGQEHLNETFQPLCPVLGETLSSRITEIIQTPRSEEGALELDRIVKEVGSSVGAKGTAKKIAQVFIQTVGEQAKAYFGDFWDQFRAEEPQLGAFDELLGQIAQPEEASPRLAPEEVTRRLDEQTNLLVENSVCKAMAVLILDKACGIQGLTTNQVNAYIEASRQRGTDFKTVLFDTIDNTPDISLLRRLWGKATYTLMEPTVRLYTTSFIWSMRGYVRDKMSQFSSNQFVPALNGMINFMNGHLTTIEGAYHRAADNSELRDSIDATILADLQRPEFNGNMTTEELYEKVSQCIIERFTPVSNFRQKAYDLLDSFRISDESWGSFLNYPIAVFTTVISIFLSPVLFTIEWVGNKVVKLALNKIASDSRLVETMVHSTEQAMGVGQIHKHAMNKFMVGQLEKAQHLMSSNQGTGDSAELAEFARNLPEATKDRLRTLVSTLFLDVGYQLNSANPARLKAYTDAVRQPPMSESVRALLEAVGIPLDIQQEAQAATVQHLTMLLKLILNGETLNELVLTGLESANQAFVNSDAHPTAQEMRALEVRRDKLLNDIIQKAIRLAVNEKFYPLRRIQKSADLFVTQVKGDVADFLQKLTPLWTTKSTPAMKAEIEKLILKRNSALQSENAPNVTLKELNDTISQPLAEKLQKLYPHFNTLSAMREEQAVVLAQREALDSLASLFRGLSTLNLSTSAAYLQSLETFRFSIFEADHTPFVSQTQARFAHIRQTLTQLSERTEIAIAIDALLPRVERGDSLRPLSAHLESLSLQSTSARQTVEDLLQNGEGMRELQETNRQAILDLRETLASIKTQFDEASETVQATLLQSAQDINREMDALKTDTVNPLLEELEKWATDLGNIVCKNPFPIDLTVFADTVCEFVIRQITLYTKSLPLFAEKEFNWEPLMHRALIAFVNERVLV